MSTTSIMRAILPLTLLQIAGARVTHQADGLFSSAHLAFYHSIPALGHHVYKCLGCGVSVGHRWDTLTWLAHFRERYAGSTVLAFADVLGDRIYIDAHNRWTEYTGQTIDPARRRLPETFYGEFAAGSTLAHLAPVIQARE